MLPISLLAIIGFISLVAIFVWRRLRLRRAWFMLKQQIAWSRKFTPRHKLVLDVGAGNNPHLRADVLCEKYLHDDLHRGGSAALDRPLVVGDASALPFKAKVFDAIIARALIEHLEDPQSFFSEAGRVAKSGLFVAPNATYEQLHSFSTHLWLIEQQADELHFTAKTQAVVNPPLNEFFTQHVMNDLAKLDNFTIEHWDSLRITYQWTGQPKGIINGQPQIDAAGFEHASTVEPTMHHQLAGLEKWRALIKKPMRVFAHSLLSAQRSINLAEIIACPKCHGDIAITSNTVNCSICHLSYPIENGIPIMLIDRARLLIPE
jgi:uncharacterized protein YbaR (Trm112 family)/SAM-dependent methyltransferase